MKTLYKNLFILTLALFFVGQGLSFDASKNTSVQFRVPAAGEANPKLLITHPDATQKIGGQFANNKMTIEARFKSCVITTDSNNLGNNWRPIVVPLPVEPISTSTITHSSGALRHLPIYLHQNKIKFYGGQYPIVPIVGPTYNNNGDPNCSDATNQWHHAAGVIDGDKILFYVDGKLVGQDVRKALDNLASISSLLTSNFVVSGGVWGQPPIGHIDEIRLWNVVRSAEEIALAKDVSLKGNEPGLTGYWREDEQTLPQALDSGPNQWHGQYSGALTLGKPGESSVAGTIPHGDTTDTQNPYPISLLVSGDAVAPINASLKYKVNNGTLESVSMTPDPIMAQKFTAQIPKQAVGNQIDYFFEIQDAQGIYNLKSETQPFSFLVTKLITNKAVQFGTPTGTGKLLITNTNIGSQLTTNQITVEVRFKTCGNTGTGNNWYPLLVTTATETPSSTELWDSTVNLPKFLSIYLAENKIGFTGGERIIASTYKDSTCQADGTGGSWHHAAGVVNGEDLFFYVDGQPIGQAKKKTDIGLANIKYIHSGSFVWGIPYQGLLDEVRIWNIARDGKEIALTKDVILKGNERNLIFYGRLDDKQPLAGQAMTALDSSPNQWNGIYSGSVTLEQASDPNLKIAETLPLSDTADTQNPYPTSLFVSGDIAPTSALLKYKVDNGALQSVTATPVQGMEQKFTAQIPKQASGSQIEYFFEIQDAQGTYNLPKSTTPPYSFNVGDNLAMSFDGISGHIQVPKAIGSKFNPSPSGNLTIEARFKSGQDSSDTAGGPVGLVVGAYPDANNNLKKNFQVYLHNSSINCLGGSLVGGVRYNDGNWHHVACVIDNASTPKTVSLYVDGVLGTDVDLNKLSQATITTPLDLTNIKEVWMGKSIETNNRHFLGELDEVRVWNIARSELAIKENANRTLSGREPGLIAYYKLNETLGATQAYDSAMTPDNLVNQYPGTISSSGILIGTVGSPLGSAITTTAQPAATTEPAPTTTTTTTTTGTTETTTTTTGTTTDTTTTTTTTSGPQIVLSGETDTWIEGCKATFAVSCSNFNQYLRHMSNIAYTPTGLPVENNWNILPAATGATTFQYEIPKVGPAGTIYDMNFFCWDTAADLSKNLKVTAQANEPPAWEVLAGPEIQATDGELLTIKVSGKDPNVGDVVSYSYTHDVPSPTGMSFNEQTGEFKWDVVSVPKSAAYNFNFVAKDRCGASVEQSVEVQVYKPKIIRLAASGNMVRYLGSPSVPIRVNLISKPVDPLEPLTFSQAGIWAGKVTFETSQPDGTVLTGKTGAVWNSSPPLQQSSVSQDLILKPIGTDAIWTLPESLFSIPGDYLIKAFFDPSGVFTQNKSGSEAMVLGEIQADVLYVQFKTATTELELAEFQLQLADDYLILGQYDAVIQAATEACKASTLQAACNYYLGMAFLSKNDSHLAYTYFEKALAALPEGDEGRYEIELLMASIRRVNKAPVFNLLVAEGQLIDENSLAQLASTSDPEGDSFTLSFTALPEAYQAKLSVLDNSISFAAPEVKANELVALALKACDALGSCAEKPLNITVKQINKAPLLADITVSQTIKENQALSPNIELSASDPDGDALTCTQSGLPPNLTLNGCIDISGAPTFDAGRALPYDVTITVTDAGSPALSISKTFQIKVDHVNRAPEVVAAIAPMTVSEGQTYPAINVSLVPSYFKDPDGDPLTCTQTGLPAGLSLNNCIISGAPSYDASRTTPYTVSVTVSDGSLSVSQSFAITVNDTNRWPTLTLASTYTTGYEGIATGFSMTASDPDGDPVTINVTKVYKGSTLVANPGSIGAATSPYTHKWSWTPGYTDGGSYWYIYVKATDSKNYSSAEKYFVYYIYDVNRAPTLTLAGSYTTGYEGIPASFNMTASDPDGNPVTVRVTKVLKYVNGSFVSATASGSSISTASAPYTHKWSWTPGFLDGMAYWYIYVKATDSKGYSSAEKYFTFYIYDVPPPKLTLGTNEGTSYWGWGTFYYGDRYYTSATAQTSYGGLLINKIEFRDIFNGVVYSTQTTYCYNVSSCTGSANFMMSYGWSYPLIGTHTIEITAYDQAGQTKKVYHSVNVY